jgi:hypothetical protein
MSQKKSISIGFGRGDFLVEHVAVVFSRPTRSGLHYFGRLQMELRLFVFFTRVPFRCNVIGVPNILILQRTSLTSITCFCCITLTCTIFLLFLLFVSLEIVIFNLFFYLATF